MEEWFNDSTSVPFTSSERQPLENEPSCSSGDLMAHWTGDPLNHLFIPTDSGYPMPYEPPLMLQKDLPSYKEPPLLVSCNSLEGNIFEPESATHLAGTEKYGAQVMDINYSNNNYVVDTRDNTSPGFSANITSLEAVPSNTQPPLEQAMITPAPTDTATQKQGQKSQSQSQYRCWKHGCEGRTFSSSANFRRHLREQEGRGRKWMCMYCMKEFSRSSACRHHINEGVCFKVDAGSQQQPPPVKVLY